nr:hypothetical protein CFP56_72491 [Quercus suber]
MLITRTNILDGSLDDPALLTVAYELPEVPSEAAKPRSVSMVSLRVPHGQQTNISAGLPPEIPHQNVLDRRPSMIEYERNLTVSGDDRRRPSSSIDARRQHDIVADDRHESIHLRKSLSRARPLGDTPGQLMAQALAKHQDEKALFRSVSKHKESLGQDELVRHVSGRLGSSPVMVDSPALEMARVDSEAPISAVQISGKPRLMSSTRRVFKIGTSLPSWSRFPSHSRPERCASAGSEDDMIVRDFVACDTQQTEQHRANSPVEKKTIRGAKGWLHGGLSRSRSTTFGGFVRYYANIFSTGANQNRRSSVATGGWLEHPDLEMLSPVPHSETHHHHSLRQHLHELEEAMRVDVEALEAETDKLMHPDHVHHREKSVNAVNMPPVLEANRAKSPFRLESPFQDSYFALPIKRRSMAYGPGDEGLEEDNAIPFKLALEAEEGRLAKKRASPPPGPLHLDGVHEDGIVSAPTTYSKASAWADVYKECIARPLPGPATNLDKIDMPSSYLKSAKARSHHVPLEQFGKTAVVRRFPSVTVIDDCRGHSRSVSLISVVECGGVNGRLRSSTNELIELIENRERKEKERLLASAWKR